MQFQKNNVDNYKKQQKRINRRDIPENIPDSEYDGEMVYEEPNAYQDSTPMIDSQEQMYQPNDQSYPNQREKPSYQNYRRVPYEPKNKNPSYREDEIRDRSPKYVINAGSSGDDYELRVPTLPRRSQKYQNNNNDNYDGNQYEDYDNQDYQNESEIPKTNIYSRNRSPQYGQRYRDKSPHGYEPTNQMSPPQTFEEFNTSTDKVYNKQNNYQNYRPNQTYQPRQGYENPNQTLKNPPAGHILRDEVSNKYNNQTYNNMSYKDIQKISNRFSKVYDPHKNNNGILVEESQVTVPGAQDEVFNNRYKVLSKMKRLSNILLANKRRNEQKNKEKEFTTKTYNRHNSYKGTKRNFDRHTLGRSPHDKKSRKAFSRSPNHKFLYVSLAMISSKGPQTEDRPILRWMRLEKGGVVDLAQDERRKNKFLIKKAVPKKGLNKGFYTNPKYRDKAAKIIQSWWRHLKNIYNDRLDKIIKIQSAFRGKFVRKYMYDLFYLNFLYISFCKKIENVLQKHIKPYVWDKLFNNEDPRKKEKLHRLVSRDYRNDNNLIYPAWKKWLSNTRKLNMQNNRGRNLLQIRADKDRKLNDIRNAFNKWKYINKILDAEEKLIENENNLKEENERKNRENREKNLKKIKGLFNLVDGIDKYTKKEALNETLPKLEDYLRNQGGKGKLKRIVSKKPNYDNNLLKKSFYKWLGKTYNQKQIDDLNNRQKQEMNKLKINILKNTIIKTKNNQEKNLLKKYLYKWLKKSILLAIKEEKERNKRREEEYKRSEFKMIEKYEKTITTYKTQKEQDDDVTRKIRNALDKLKRESKEREIQLIKTIEETKENKDKNLLNYLKGSEILQRAVWRRTHRDPLGAFGDIIDNDNVNLQLRRLVKVKRKGDKDLLRKYFNIWQKNALRGVKKETIYKLLAKLIEITSNNYKKKILAKKFNKWRRIARKNPYDTLKKAKDIFDFADLIKKVYVNHHADEFFDKLWNTKNPEKYKISLTKIVKRRVLYNKDDLRKAFDKWRKNVHDDHIRRLKSKMVLKIYEKKHPDRSKELLNKYFQIWKNNVFKDNLRRYRYDINQMNRTQTKTTRMFVKSIVKGIDRRAITDTLRDYFNRWKKIVELAKNEDYQRNKKRIMLAKIIEKKSSNNYLTLLQYLLRWKNKIYELKVADIHKPYRRKIIRILLTKNDKEQLQRCFTRWKYGGLKRLPIMPYIVAKRFLKKVLCRRAFYEFVKKMTERNPKVLKQKGRALIKALDDIKDNRIREFLKKLILIIRTKYLGKIQPRVNEKVKEYYLRKYFDRWVNNTLGVIEKRKEIITKWIKTKITENKNKIEKRKKELLRYLLLKKSKYNKLLLSYALLKYLKNVKLDQQIEYAKIIQAFCRGKLDIIMQDKMKKREELAKLIYKLYREKILKDLRDLSNRTGTYMKEIREKSVIYRYRKELLVRSLYRIDRNKRLAILRKYWNIWKNNPGCLEKYTLMIQKKLRQLISRNKLESIKKLRAILLKLLMANKGKGKELLYSKFYQWLKTTRRLKCEEYSKIIQDFCRQKLDDYLRNKLGNYLEELVKKYIVYLIKNNAKVDKLNKALRHNPLQEGLEAIKRRAFINIIKDILIQIVIKRERDNKQLILRRYFEKWRKNANKLKNRENDLISKIQANYRGYNFRKLFYLDEKRIELLRIIFEKLIMASNPRNILASTLARWRKNVAKLSCHENARIIQDFCRGILEKILENKNKKNKENYLYLARILKKIQISPREFFERLKEIRRKKILEELVKKLARKRLIVLKYSFDKIRKYPRFRYLITSMHIRKDLKERLLRKYLNKWRNKVMRFKGIMELLRIIFNNYTDFKNNLLRHNLYRWQYKAKYLYQKEQARIISEFCKDILKKKEAMRNWHKLSYSLKNRGRDKEVDIIIEKLRILLGLNKLVNRIKYRAKKDVIDALNNNKYVKIFTYKIRHYFERNDYYWNNNLLRQYFEKWRDNTFKLRKRDYRIREMMEIYDKLRKKIALNTISDAFLVKKFLHDYPLMGAIGFLRRIKDLSKDSNLAKDLLKAKNDLEPKKRTDLIKKLYKVYAYKVLNKLFDDLEDIEIRKIYPLKKYFIDLLRDNALRRAERRYNDNKENEIVPKKIKTSFRLKKPNRIRDDQKKKLIYVSLLPSLVKLINRKILEEKEYAFNKIKDKSNADKFCELYKRWTEKQELKPKKELVDKLRKIYYLYESEGPLLLKLFKLLRRESIRRIFKSAPKIRKVLGIIYVTRLLVMQREIAKEKFLRQLIRRWRYIVFSKKLALNKMKTIYKNLHMTYLEMANCLFGDENKDNPSVIKEFERFGTSVGMWENEKPNEKEQEKYVKLMKTQYVFDSVEFEKFQNKYYPTEREENVYEEDEKVVEKQYEIKRNPKKESGQGRFYKKYEK